MSIQLGVSIVVGSLLLLAAMNVRTSLAREINRWPKRSDVNRWLRLVRYVLLIVILIICVAAVRFLVNVGILLSNS